MLDPTLSDIDFRNKMAWVWTTLNSCTFRWTNIGNRHQIIPTIFRQKIFDEDTILSELNPLLYEEVVTCGIINYIKECDFFRTCREDLQGWILNSCNGLQAIWLAQSKLRCVVRMGHAESGPNDHRKDAPPFIIQLASIFKSTLSVNYAIYSKLKCINLIRTLLWPGE